MLQVRKKLIMGLIITMLIASVVVKAYTPTNLDTKRPPAQVSYDIEQPSEETVIYENDRFIYAFKDERDILSIYDKINQYTWKSGLDIAASKAVKAALRKDEPLGYEPLEEKMNETFTGIANSLITLEYYDDSNNIKRLASASEDALSRLMHVVGEDNHFILDIEYSEKDIALKVHLYFTEVGYDIKIFNEEITGEDTDVLAAVMLNPFLGASGGRYQLYDEETGKHGDKVDKPAIPGYVFVPDGSGALIRFNDYKVSLKTYTADVYGVDLSKDTYNNMITNDSFKPFKEPLMPVYGIAHGDEQAAFVGYATSGDEHMEILVVPEENTTLYTWAYPRFVYNSLYYQVFNKRGEGYFTLYEERESFDVAFSYNFLAGGGETGHQADYVGMALTYRDYLLETGTLTEVLSDETDIPLRLDFIMSDQKKSVIGYENVVATSVDQVDEILNDLGDLNINAGLYGWQDGGVSASKPWTTDYSSAIGSKKDYRSLVDSYKDKGIDISMATDYVNINEEQMSYLGNAVKHVNSWYLDRFMYGDMPFNEFSFARPSKSVEWLIEQTEDLGKIGLESHTINGMSSILLSDHSNDALSVEETMDLYQETMVTLSEDFTLNMTTPNQYLWQYTDRFLQAPVYPTQFLIETDTVPFLQMVLNGTMEVYAPYSNFSFSGQKDILRMVDYNIYPSFVLTKEASWLLSSTNSLDMYSTEYAQYSQLIRDLYETVNQGLGPVIGAQWTKRQVVEEGIIVNTYDNGIKIVINYTESHYDYMGETIEALSYGVIKEAEHE